MNFISPNEVSDEASCPLLVISDADWRLRKSDQEFVERGLGYAEFDFYSWPNTVKGILRQNGFKKELLDKIVSVARSLHEIKKLILLIHITEDQTEAIKDLRTAKAILAKDLPADLEIILAYSKATPHGLEYIILD